MNTRISHSGSKGSYVHIPYTEYVAYTLYHILYYDPYGLMCFLGALSQRYGLVLGLFSQDVREDQMSSEDTCKLVHNIPVEMACGDETRSDT